MEGYLQAAELAYQYELGTDDKPEVEQILFSNQYGQAYIYLLFVRQTNPIWYQGGSLVKYKFLDAVDDSTLNKNNALVVATDQDLITTQNTVHEIVSQGGETRFKLYLTNHIE